MTSVIATTNETNNDGEKKSRAHSLSSYLSNQNKIFMDGNVSVETKLETASSLEPFLMEDDAYISFKGKSHQAHLPSLTNWNGNSGLRKGYSLLMWVRPRLLMKSKEDFDNNSNNQADNNLGDSSTTSTTDQNRNEQRVMYRFGTSTEDSIGTGICVVCSPWKAVPFDGDDNTNISNDEKLGTNLSTTTQRWQLETMLTAYTLPHYKSNQLPPPGLRSTYVQQPLILVENEWQLLGFSHTQQPAVWSLTVNGRLLGSDKLPYPTLPEKHHVNSMEYCSLFHNITSSGAMMSVIPTSEPEKRDYQKTASELQAEANNSIQANSRYNRTVDFSLDLAALSLYADRSIPFACLAVAADAGPALALQKAGRILPTLPPVANWTKGASLEGPKVGIPLVVHSSALSLQELSSAPHLVFCCSAISARILGSPTANSTRLVCTMQLQPGSTAKAPRVGLISPAAPLRIPEDELPCLYVVGNVQVHQAISKFLLQLPDLIGEELSSSINIMTKNLSVAILDQEILSCLVQPFFLSLCPPGKIFDRHHRLYDESLRHLHALYADNAKYAARLIGLFSMVIRSGGGRAHEEVLQSGLLHVLASSLRLSLIRASRLKLFQDNPSSTTNVDDFIQRVNKIFPDESSIAPPQRGAGNSPTFIPPAITKACCELIDTCCGPPKLFLETLSPHHQIKRTSDLALTAVFGLALDFDLWAGHPSAAASILDCVSQRYGGICVTSGFVLRSQISVQHFLDMIRLHFDESIFSQESPAPKEVEKCASHMSSLLQAMLLSSLSNPRSQSQSENDISACVSSLCDCPLGSVGTHVILNAIANVLVWCDVLPIEATFATPRTQSSDVAHEKDKIQVASRLGNNILVAQFHDVIAPMILSRTVSSGEQSNLQIRQSSKEDSESCDRCSICWQNHWRLSLLLFSWVASISGPKGIIATKTCGNLLLASSHAGTLEYALENSDKVFISTLFLPSPSMSLLTSHHGKKELNYTDLLADRLETLMPLIPGLVVALLSRLRGTGEESTSKLDPSTFTSLMVMGEIFTSMIGSFQRVYGSLIHSWNKPGITGTNAFQTQKSGSVSQSIKVAKVHAPHLVSLAFLLENHLLDYNLSSSSTDSITITKAYNNENNQGGEREASTTCGEVLLTEISIVFPVAGEANGEQLLRVLRSCQRSVVYIAAGLTVNAMNAGGCGATIPLWQTLVLTLQQMSQLLTNNQLIETKSTVTNPLPKLENAGVPDTLSGFSTGVPDTLCGFGTQAFKTILRRLISLIFSKALNQTHPRDPWGYELSSSIAHLCDWVERTGLLEHSDPQNQFVEEQIILLCVILDLMSYCRESTGWCQVFPQSESIVPNVVSNRDSATQTSKLLLPILRPLLRIVLRCLIFIPPSCQVNVLHIDGQRSQSLLEIVASELDLTLTAAIVGLSFSSARDTALQALSAIRNVLNLYEAAQNERSASLCKSLIIKIAEELRVRYESERQLREKTLFDAYEGGGDLSSKKIAADGSRAVERLILGNSIFDAGNSNEHSVSVDGETSAIGRGGGVGDDFVVFHEPLDSDRSSGSDNKLGYEFLNGLGAALELWKKAGDDSITKDVPGDLLPLLKPFLDAWDVASTEDSDRNTQDQSLWKQNEEPALQGSRNESHFGSDTASDAMSTFFEVAATEKNRLKEISTRFLPSYRYSRMAFADRFCWTRQMESVPDKDDDWDRGIGDGNRDIRSRIPTMPCFPQFRRYLPKYLDNASGGSTTAGVVTTVSDIGVPLKQTELGAFTKSLLETGHLEIIDITKRPADEEEEPELALPNTFVNEADEEENFFADSEGIRITENNHSQSSNGGVKGDMESALQEPKTEEFQTPEEELAVFPSDTGGKGQHNITTSSFSTPPDNASSSLSLLFSAAAGLVEEHIENCLHVKAEGTRQCTMLITTSHLILEYDGNIEGFFEGEILARQEEAERQRMVEEVGSTKENDLNDLYTQKSDRRQRELAALRSKSIRWNLTEVSHVYLRRYRLRDTALEIFFIPTGSTSFGGYGLFSPSSSLYVDFGPGYDGIKRRDDAAFAIMRRSPSQAIKQWPDRSDQFLHEQLNRLTLGWVEGRITNFDYLLHLNMLSGRSYNDICQYPVFPWVLSNYTSEDIPDLRDKNNFRDLSKPVGALNEERLRDFLDRFRTFADPSIPPFMYGSHYSTSAGVVLHFLVRLHPFAGLHRQLQGGHFDVADRLFSSIPRTWSMCTGSSAGEVKELTPEWYCNPSFLRNTNIFKLGTSQDGEVINDVILPPWAKGSPERFVEVMRAALESEICSDMLSSWIDLIFGKKQQGQAAIDANNVFFYLTYYGTVDVASIEDESLRQATELQIAHFGQCPMQLFKRLHVRRLPRESYDVNFYQVLSAYSQKANSKFAIDNSEGSMIQSFDRPTSQSVNGEPLFLPFFAAPLSHWVHLDAPPPGPHAPLVAVRFAGVDRCLAVDAKGVFHSFRWAWRPEEIAVDNSTKPRQYFDHGCFIAQRELPRFRVLPRLMYSPQTDCVVVAISKTLFASRSVLLVLSDGDGCGSLAMQLVDPAKGEIRGEVLVPQIHSGRITCITTDPIGTAAGHGGVGGELCLVGSADGTASLWRFMSSHYLPLRPRVKFRGHQGAKISAVALCASLHIAVTLSADRCCIHSVGNGALIRSFPPPIDTIQMDVLGNFLLSTSFAHSPAMAVSAQGYIVVVCETIIKSAHTADRTILTLHMFSIEGVSIGSKPLESWRGVPHKMQCTPDGTAVIVCCGRGVTIHRVSVCQPLEFLDEFQVTESDELDDENVLHSAWDVDFGPSRHRPVAAAAGCSNGVLRLHALPGISAWSERQTKNGLTQTVSSALATPARRINQAVRDGIGFGRQIAGIGRDLSQEVSNDVKERGVSGFLGGIFRKK